MTEEEEDKLSSTLSELIELIDERTERDEATDLETSDTQRYIQQLEAHIDQLQKRQPRAITRQDIRTLNKARKTLEALVKIATELDPEIIELIYILRGEVKPAIMTPTPEVSATPATTERPTRPTTDPISRFLNDLKIQEIIEETQKVRGVSAVAVIHIIEILAIDMMDKTGKAEASYRELQQMIGYADQTAISKASTALAQRKLIIKDKTGRGMIVRLNLTGIDDIIRTHQLKQRKRGTMKTIREKRRTRKRRKQ